ncbi:hypothetical protein [Bacillus safensis]|uniref:hypothetical protein n=1 Tax=Bacillus safensis TaxID=561879 RepID=UPI00366E263B
MYKNKRIDPAVCVPFIFEHTHPTYQSPYPLVPKLYHPIPKLKNENAANMANQSFAHCLRSFILLTGHRISTSLHWVTLPSFVTYTIKDWLFFVKRGSI